jgi:hypothetical protein
MTHTQDLESHPDYQSVAGDRLVRLDRGTEVSIDEWDVRNAREEGEIGFDLLARYAWLKAKYPANISEAQVREYRVLSSLVLPGINFTEYVVDRYCYVGYLAYRAGYTWEDWRAELENLDFKI